MALTTNSIGSHQFVALLGNPIAPQQTVQAESRPGVAGTEFTLTARKGSPFTLISQVDVEDYNAAVGKAQGYSQMIEFDLYELIQGGVSSLVHAQPYRVKVLQVTIQDAATIRGASGYKLDATSHGWCVCRWELFSVPIS